jgi:dihydrodipicolinate synthase/N-acetylneuraminate lyase
VTTGTTGEFTSLSGAEHRRVIEAYVDAAAGRVPVVAGVGSLTTSGAIDLARHAERTGADAVMLLPPFYDAPTFDALVAFLSAVAGSIGIPIVYYNIPSSTGVRLDAAQIAALGDIPGVDYLKDTSGDAVVMADLLADKGSRIQAFNGWDTLTFFGLASGARASVWGAANLLPREAAALYDALAVDNDLVAAREIWRPLWRLSAFLESVPYVSGVKAGLEIVGAPAGPVREPLQPLTGEQRDRLAEILAGARVAAAA